MDLKKLGLKWKKYISQYKNDLEKERKWEIFNFYASADVLLLAFSYLSIPIFFSLIFISSFEFNSYVIVVSVGILLFLVLLCFLTTINFLKEKRTAYFKIKDRNVFKDFLNKVFKDITYMQQTCFFTVEELEESKMFKFPIDTIISDDNFYGNYKNVKYKISEVKLDSNFKGLIFAFDFSKKMEKTLVISPRKDYRLNNIPVYIVELMAFLSFLFYVLFISDYILIEKLVALIFVLFFVVVINYINNKKHLENIYTESVDFEKKYSVLSDSQVESRYVVTPSFIERFLKLEKIFNTDKIFCSVCNETIMFAIETNKDFFELDSIFLPIDDERHIIHFYNELNEIITIIDLLKIDENIKL